MLLFCTENTGEKGAGKAPKHVCQSQSGSALFIVTPRRMLSGSTAGGTEAGPWRRVGGLWTVERGYRARAPRGPAFKAMCTDPGVERHHVRPTPGPATAWGDVDRAAGIRLGK